MGGTAFAGVGAASKPAEVSAAAAAIRASFEGDSVYDDMAWSSDPSAR